MDYPSNFHPDNVPLGSRSISTLFIDVGAYKAGRKNDLIPNIPGLDGRTYPLPSNEKDLEELAKLKMDNRSGAWAHGWPAYLRRAREVWKAIRNRTAQGREIEMMSQAQGALERAESTRKKIEADLDRMRRKAATLFKETTTSIAGLTNAVTIGLELIVAGYLHQNGIVDYNPQNGLSRRDVGSNEFLRASSMILDFTAKLGVQDPDDVGKSKEQVMKEIDEVRRRANMVGEGDEEVIQQIDCTEEDFITTNTQPFTGTKDGGDDVYVVQERGEADTEH